MINNAEGKKYYQRSAKAQASIEFLFVVGFAMLLIIPSLSLFGMFVQETSDTVTQSQINKIGNYMINTATQTYHGTNGTVIVIEVNFPEGVSGLEVMNGNELVFTFADELSGQAVFYSDILLNGTFTEDDINKGIKKFKFTATESGSIVLIERITKY